MNKKIEQYIVNNSSLLLRADYDHLMGTLKLYFRSGEVYDFLGVPYEQFTLLQEAESAGKYFHKEIKPKFEHMKITKKTKPLNKNKQTKNIILENFGNEEWFQAAVARIKDDKVVIYIKDSKHIETIKNIVPKDFNIELEFKINSNELHSRKPC